MTNSIAKRCSTIDIGLDRPSGTDHREAKREELELTQQEKEEEERGNEEEVAYREHLKEVKLDMHEEEQVRFDQELRTPR